MNDRIKMQDVERALVRYCKAMDLPCAYDVDPDTGEVSRMDYREAVRVGALHIDNAPVYGGAEVRQYVGDGGGVGHVWELGSSRRPMRQLFDVLNVAWRVADAAKQLTLARVG